MLCICDHDGLVAKAPDIEALRTLKSDFEKYSNRHCPQLRMLLRSGYASEPRKLHSELRGLEAIYENASTREVLRSLAVAAALCSGIVIISSFT